MMKSKRRGKTTSNRSSSQGGQQYRVGTLLTSNLVLGVNVPFQSKVMTFELQHIAP